MKRDFKNQKAHFLTRVTALFLAVILVAALFPAPVYAETSGRTYYIDTDREIQYGIVQSPFSASAGETVTVTAVPNAGFITASVTVLMDSNDHPYQYKEEFTDIRHLDPNTISFSMPEANVEISAEFVSDRNHRIFICDMEGGTVVPSVEYAWYGDPVTLTIRPDNGYAYVPESLKIYDVDQYLERETELPWYAVDTIEENSQYSFEVSSFGPVYVRAEFTPVSEETKHHVSVDDTTAYGSLSASEEWAAAGWTVTVDAQPETRLGFMLKELSVTDSEGNAVETVFVQKNRYTFTMPEDDVFITGVFEEAVYSITVNSQDVDVPSGRETNARIDARDGETPGFPASLTATIPSGSELAALKVTGETSGKEIPYRLEDHSEGSNIYHYSFTMPEENVLVSASFTLSKYTLSLDSAYEGTVSVSCGDLTAQSVPVDITYGETVTLDIEAPEHYDLNDLWYSCTIYGVDRRLRLTFTEENDRYTAEFTMPESDVLLQPENIAEMSKWSDLQEAIDHAPNYWYAITLYGNLRAGAGDKPITIPAGKNIVLDLNGYTLDRNLGGAAADGSAIHVLSDGKLTIESSDGNNGAKGMITGGNTTGNGGGILCEGTLFLNGGIISKNSAGKSGGGFYVNKGNLWMRDDVIVEKNNATDGGGVGVGGAGRVFLNGGVIRSNVAAETGGGVCMNFGYVSINGPTIEENTAKSGGGIGRITHYELYVQNCTIKNNTATEIGGGFYANAGGGSVDFTDVTFSGNKAEGGGGGAFLSESLGASFRNVTFRDNTSGAGGGAMHIRSNGTVFQGVPKICTVRDSTFEDNAAQNGGSIYLLGILELTGSTFTNNHSDLDGGAIYDKGTLNPDNCTFTGNFSKRNGGAIYQCADTSLKLQGSGFTENTALENGGALYLENGQKTEMTLSACGLSGNIGENGGGIYTAGNGTLALKDSELTGNHADEAGGAVYAKSGKFQMVLIDTKMQKNSAAKEGGAVLAQGSVISMKGLVVIEGNQAPSGPNLSLKNNAYIGNPGLYEGSSVYVSGTKGTAFAKNISKYQMRYFKADGGNAEFSEAGARKVNVPIVGALFGEGSVLWALLIAGIGIAAGAVIFFVHRHKKKGGVK